MDIPKNKIGLPSSDIISAVNLKCGSVLIGSFLGKSGFHPAYHMAKNNWITAALDGSADDEDIKFLLDISFEATKK